MASFRKTLLWVLSLFFAAQSVVAAQSLDGLTAEQKQALLQKYASSTGAAPTVAPQMVAEEPAPEVEAKPIPLDVAAPKDPDTGLRPFGYDIFSGQPTTFAPATDIPVPVDYVVGPGDNVRVQLYGKENVEYSLVVTRDGNLQIPEIGSIGVIGLRFDELKRQIEDLVARRKIGVNADVTMGVLRSITVFVLGDARQPGAYTVSSLSTITNALLVSGGVKPIGSLRNIQLKRAGKLVQTLDLYRLLLKGDTSQDVRLQPGDTLYVPVVGDTVSIAGAVKRPAIYELKKRRSLADLVDMAGGTGAEAWKAKVTITRVSADGRKELFNRSLGREASRFRLQAGDEVVVHRVLDRADNRVSVEGHVERPQSFAWKPGLKLTDIVKSPRDLKERADLNFALLTRLEGDRERLVTMYLNPAELFADPAAHDIELQPRDVVHFFSAVQSSESERDQVVENVVKQLRNQANLARPAEVVRISGAVRFPGTYPLNLRTGSTRIPDLVRAAGGFAEHSSRYDMDFALLMRLDPQSNKYQPVYLQPKQIFSGQAVPGLDNLLPGDELYFFTSLKSGEERREEVMQQALQVLRDQESFEEPAPIVSIGGAVRFPGQYPLDHGRTSVQDLIRAAGGLQDLAYLYEVEITSIAREGADFESRVLPRHLTIQLSGADDAAAAVALQPRDVVAIRYIPGTHEYFDVELSGEFRFPGTYRIRKGDQLREVVRRAGGLTENAFPFGAVFTRQDLKQKERKQAETLIERLQRQLASKALAAGEDDAQAAAADQAMVMGLIEQLQSYDGLGRISLDLENILENSDVSMALEPGDHLHVPDLSQEVTVIGEVQLPTSHFFKKGMSRNDYIEMSGGVTELADAGRIYVVRANGQVEVKGGWFARYPKILPGDTIVVPLDPTPVEPLTLVGGVTQIIYQLGLSAAAFKSVGAF